ncbi:hypothetical protein FNJ84_12415 [Paracoccus sp. M683]|uniref:hypothetical protein n=1 Tax=Paracoccus sp. M683 TaxID=2594268 RepID=UPI001180119E|nr:hypothetical protein [Paracoccus sp. M683]TRW96857.1 hypothetical protein FNJ84_12415 [Paracoccus sp. M683]
MTGGVGADRFIFNARAESTVATASRDVITYCDRAQGDKIVLTDGDGQYHPSSSTRKSTIIRLLKAVN